jgi:hypothetical protein
LRFFHSGSCQRKTLGKKEVSAEKAHLGRLLEKVAKPYPVVNRNSQSYARENIVSLNTTSFGNCRLSGSFRFFSTI